MSQVRPRHQEVALPTERRQELVRPTKSGSKQPEEWLPKDVGVLEPPVQEDTVPRLVVGACQGEWAVLEPLRQLAV